MSTHDLPTKPAWLVKSRRAVRCARRLDQETTNLTPQDMEDPIQVATMTYRKHHRDGRHPVFCFVCTPAPPESIVTLTKGLF